MTDGGDAPRTRDNSDEIREQTTDRSADNDSPDRADLGNSERRAQTSPAEDGTGQTASSTQTHTPEATGEQTETVRRPNQQTPSELGEPTPQQIARIQARSSSLDRGQTTEYTTDLRSLDSTVQLQWGVWTAIAAFVLGMIASAILGSVGVPAYFGTVFLGVFLVLGSIWVVLRYRVWVYQIRTDSLYLQRGVLTHVRSIVPYVRIQHVDTSRSPLERALGLSTLVVYTAGSRGADVSIPGLKPDEARDLQQRLKELAIESEGDDAL